METHHVDLVRVDNFRPLAEPASVRSTERFRWRAVPGSGRTASRTSRATWCGDPLASFSHVWRWPGWENCRITWPLGRPSPAWRHARSGRDRSCRVPRNRRWSSFRPRLPRIRLRSARPGHSGIFGRQVPVSVIARPPGRVDLELPLSVVIPSQANRTTAGRVGTRQQRARPRRACPQPGTAARATPVGR
jgi:hypothetical protein